MLTIWTSLKIYDWERVKGINLLNNLLALLTLYRHREGSKLTPNQRTNFGQDQIESICRRQINPLPDGKF